MTFDVWTGVSETAQEDAAHPAQILQQPAAQGQHSPPGAPLLTAPPLPDAARRQLTVMFCDVVESTALSGQLDPEEYRDVLRAYQAACVAAIQRFDGYIAQHLGDGLLVYFGFPTAHEDDAQRAILVGLGMLDAMHTLNTRPAQEHGVRLSIRVGMHTGLTVIGDIGAGQKHELLALGEAPNIAARIQSLATSDTVAISADAYCLVEGYFTVEDLGRQTLRGVAEPLQVYRVLRHSGAQSRLDVAGIRGLTPLVGREQDVGLRSPRRPLGPDETTEDQQLGTGKVETRRRPRHPEPSRPRGEGGTRRSLWEPSSNASNAAMMGSTHAGIDADALHSFVCARAASAKSLVQ